jgi:hypothetical protein
MEHKSVLSAITPRHASERMSHHELPIVVSLSQRNNGREFIVSYPPVLSMVKDPIVITRRSIVIAKMPVVRDLRKSMIFPKSVSIPQSVPFTEKAFLSKCHVPFPFKMNASSS